jgi:hypothetical protein
MLSTLISFDRSARRLSSLALVGAAALAACDNDNTVGPKPAAIPTQASPIVGVAKPGALIITIVDQNGTAPTTGGAQFTYTPAGGAQTYFLIDNGQGDSDPTPNVIRKLGLLGTYSVCQTVAPTDYVLPSPACQTASVSPGSIAQLQFVDKTVALVQWTALDMFYQGVAGTTFTVDVGNGPVKVADNAPLDLDKSDGRFMVKAPNGTATVCPFLAPTNWYFNAGQGCGGYPAPAGQTTFLNDWHLFAVYSVYVLVADPITWGAGPSEYIVKNAAGFSETLIDEGKNDRRPGKLGHLYMLLPSAGDYTICQTVPPPGTKLAIPTCVDVTVKGKDDPLVLATFTSDWQ